jgi:hypothetical protein
MTEFGLSLAAIGALSLTVTKVVDLIRNLPWFKDKWIGSWVWNVVALIVGLAFALGWQISIAGPLVALVPALADHAANFTGTMGQVLTGALIGGAAGFWHDLLHALSAVAGKNDALAGPARTTVTGK